MTYIRITAGLSEVEVERRSRVTVIERVAVNERETKQGMLRLGKKAI